MWARRSQRKLNALHKKGRGAMEPSVSTILASGDAPISAPCAEKSNLAAKKESRISAAPD